jgi:hypothetical protein
MNYDKRVLQVDYFNQINTRTKCLVSDSGLSAWLGTTTQHGVRAYATDNEKVVSSLSNDFSTVAYDVHQEFTF